MYIDHMHFSGWNHGDQVDLYILPDHSVTVSCSNDGYPDRMGGGGYSLPMPEYLLIHYDQAAFVSWLKQNFWINGEIDSVDPTEEEKVRSFLAKR